MQTIMKFKRAILLVLILALTFAGCSARPNDEEQSTRETQSREVPEARQVKLMTSSPLIKTLVEEIAGDFHVIESLVSKTEELRHASPNPSDLIEKKFKAFFYLGANYEPFAKEYVDALDKGKVNVVNLSRGIEVKTIEVNKISEPNYYYITNSTNYKIVLNSIKNTLQELDPGRRRNYDEIFQSKVVAIDEYNERVKAFVESHPNLELILESDLLDYFAQDYRKDAPTIQAYRMARQNQRIFPDSQASSSQGAEKQKVLLYLDDVVLKKYADDITKDNIIPVKLSFYGPGNNMLEEMDRNLKALEKALE